MYINSIFSIPIRKSGFVKGIFFRFHNLWFIFILFELNNFQSDRLKRIFGEENIDSITKVGFYNFLLFGVPEIELLLTLARSKNTYH